MKADKNGRRFRVFRFFCFYPVHPLILKILIQTLPRTSKPQIARGAVRGVRAAGSNAVSVAVGVVAKVRAAAHAFCLSDVGSRGIYSGAFEVEGGAEPVTAPFPDVARDVVDAVVVGGE